MRDGTVVNAKLIAALRSRIHACKKGSRLLQCQRMPEKISIVLRPYLDLKRARNIGKKAKYTD
jgi:hypothetical protein